MTVLVRHVDHVQRDERRVAEFNHLRREVKIALEIRGIDDDHDEVGGRHLGEAVQKHVARDLFIQRLRAEAVGAGQIEQGEDRILRRAEQAALLALDGHARVIADLGPEAGERIE